MGTLNAHKKIRNHIHFLCKKDNSDNEPKKDNGDNEPKKDNSDNEPKKDNSDNEP